MDAIRGQEAVVDALLEAVGVERVAEVEVRVAVFVAQRGGGHAELVGGLKPFKDFTPVGIFFRAAAMALVHDDEVKEVSREFLVQPRPALVFRDRLVGGEIKFAAEDRLATFDFVPGIAERREDFVLGIVHQEIAVSQI